LDIRQKIHKVLLLYKQLDNGLQKFARHSRMSCLPGCGKCCENPDVEASVLEMLPLALDLWQKNTAQQWWDRIENAQGKEQCVFYEPHSSGAGKGRCGIYPFRPLICRLYGYSAKRGRDNRLALFSCLLIREDQPTQFQQAQKKINAGLKVPCISDATMKASALDPELGTKQYPINKAVQLAIEKVGLWQSFEKKPLSKPGKGREMFKKTLGTMIFSGILYFLMSHLGLALAQEKASVEPKAWQWKLGLDERVRWEYRNDFDFNDERKDNGSLFFHRFKFNVSSTFMDDNQNEKAIIFVEGLDAQVGGYQLKPLASQEDNFDFHQGYLQLFDVLGFDIKGGRMEVKYGNGRLIAQPAWSNRMRHFDGGILHYEKTGGFIDLMYLQDVKYDDNNFNRSLDDEFLGGFYGGYQKDKKANLYEFYFLPQFITTGASDIERYTVGARLKGSLPHQVSWEIEFPYQFGDNGTRDIKAHALNVSLAKEWEAEWKPKLYFEYNHASGDDSSSDGEVNTFIPLYQSTHDPYGLMDFFRWQNMREVALKLDASPMAKWKFTPQVNFFWLENKNDSWYSSSGSVIRSKTSGERDSYVGTEASLRAYYEINKYVKWETGYAHFFSGGYVKDTGADDDADFVYTQMTFKY